MKKVALFAPGPTPVPESALLAMAGPMIHHRSSDFVAIFKEVREGLKKVYQTKEEVLIFSSSGTGAMESAVVNLLSPGDKAIAVRSGKFGERWSNILKTYGCEPVNMDVEWGYAVSPQKVADMLKADPAIKAVFIQSLETSTGVEQPVRELAEVTQNTPAVLVVDAISNLGACPIPTDQWGLDVVISGSQKALMLPPGLGFASIGPKALEKMKTSTLPKFYFSWERELKNQIDGKGAFTSAVSLMLGLKEVLKLMDSVGLEEIYRQTTRRSKAFKAAVKAWGLNLYAKENPSDALTVVECPDSLDGEALVKWLKNNYSMYIAGGQDQAKGRIFRVAHMGYISDLDTMATVSAVEMALRSLGYKFDLGSGCAAAQKVFGEAK